MADRYIPGQAFQLAQAGTMAAVGALSDADAFKRAIMLAELAQGRQQANLDWLYKQGMLEHYQRLDTMAEEELLFRENKWKAEMEILKAQGSVKKGVPIDSFHTGMRGYDTDIGGAVSAASKILALDAQTGGVLSDHSQTIIKAYNQALSLGNMDASFSLLQTLGQYRLADKDGYVSISNLVRKSWGRKHFVKESGRVKQWLQLSFAPTTKEIAADIGIEGTLKAVENLKWMDFELLGGISWDKSGAEIRAEQEMGLTALTAEQLSYWRTYLNKQVNEGKELKPGERKAYSIFQQWDARKGETQLSLEQAASEFANMLLDPLMSRLGGYGAEVAEIFAAFGTSYDEYEAQREPYTRAYTEWTNAFRLAVGKATYARQFDESWGTSEKAPPANPTAAIGIEPEGIDDIDISQRERSEVFRNALMADHPTTYMFKVGGLFDDIINKTTNPNNPSELKINKEILQDILLDIDMNIMEPKEKRYGYMRDKTAELDRWISRHILAVNPDFNATDLFGRIDAIFQQLGIPMNTEKPFQRTEVTRFVAEETLTRLAPKMIKQEDIIEHIERLKKKYEGKDVVEVINELGTKGSSEADRFLTEKTIELAKRLDMTLTQAFNYLDKMLKQIP